MFFVKVGVFIVVWLHWSLMLKDSWPEAVSYIKLTLIEVVEIRWNLLFLGISVIELHKFAVISLYVFFLNQTILTALSIQNCHLEHILSKLNS